MHPRLPDLFIELRIIVFAPKQVSPSQMVPCDLPRISGGGEKSILEDAAKVVTQNRDNDDQPSRFLAGEGNVFRIGQFKTAFRLATT